MVLPLSAGEGRGAALCDRRGAVLWVLCVATLVSTPQVQTVWPELSRYVSF